MFVIIMEREVGYGPYGIHDNDKSSDEPKGTGSSWIGWLTGTSSSEAAAAGHQARDDMQESGMMPERQDTKVAEHTEQIVNDAFNGGNYRP